MNWKRFFSDLAFAGIIGISLAVSIVKGCIK